MTENESCRIVTISSTIQEATTFIESVKALAGSSESSPSLPITPSGPLTVRWTIKNRYYVADVHFSAWSMDRVIVELFEGQKAPAVVFVWTDGQPYVEHVKEIARLMKLGEYEPEVALAVRMRGMGLEISRLETEDGGDENGDIDSMLMSCGFEYVDATRTKDEQDDIPGLPRVVDALSTIIWPSMRSNKDEPGVGGGSGSLDLNEADTDEKERERMLQELLHEIKDEGEEVWEEAMTMSPMEMSTDFEVVDGVKGSVSLGFEDDFSADTAYQTLGSVSDFEEEEDKELDAMFGMLETYKREMADVEDDEERRLSAARVALGLVYGLKIN